jgi:hypothetical protein
MNLEINSIKLQIGLKIFDHFSMTGFLNFILGLDQKISKTNAIYLHNIYLEDSTLQNK